MRPMGILFASVLEWCYKLTHDYGWAIVFFTVLTRIIMLPISVMVQLNSIKMVKMYPEMNRIKAKYFGNKDAISEENYKLYKREKYHPMLDLIPVLLQLIILMGVIEGIKRVSVSDTVFAGFDLALIPVNVWGRYVIVPLVAALSAWFMCFVQNHINVLQSEQSRANKAITMAISVGLSLYLGFLVNGGVALYWTVGNILAVLQLYLLNTLINPEKYIEYDELNASKAELDKVIKERASVKHRLSSEEIAREKADYKRFVRYGTKQIVFYSEKNGFYKYYKGVIEYILKKTDIIIHYITSDISDEVFSISSDSFQTYYISENRLIVLMMKMDADIVVMTMPDLQRYQIKRSLIRDDTEYVYMDHGINSLNMVLRKHAIDHFDTIFVANRKLEDEIREQERVYGLTPKRLVRYGYCLIDSMIENYVPCEKSSRPQILIAPSWQNDNIMDLCINDLLEALLGKGYSVILRPHPQYVKHHSGDLEKLNHRWGEYEDFELQTDFSSDSTVFDSDILITDWSGIAYEYSFATLKPTLFIDTPMKVMNPDYEEIDVVPFDIEIRSRIGISIRPEECRTADVTVERLLTQNQYSAESMKTIREQYLYNVGKSAQIGGDYLIQRVIEYSKNIGR